MKSTLTATAALFCALLAIAVTGAERSAVARDDSGPVCGYGTGPLCKTVTKEVCLRWAVNTLSLGLSQFGSGITCEHWDKTTLYYYFETGTGGTTPKPGLF
jgi:hypothetical protein